MAVEGDTVAVEPVGVIVSSIVEVVIGQTAGVNVGRGVNISNSPYLQLIYHG